MVLICPTMEAVRIATGPPPKNGNASSELHAQRVGQTGPLNASMQIASTSFCKTSIRSTSQARSCGPIS
jgi:hypothetical protein